MGTTDTTLNRRGFLLADFSAKAYAHPTIQELPVE